MPGPSRKERARRLDDVQRQLNARRGAERPGETCRGRAAGSARLRGDEAARLRDFPEEGKPRLAEALERLVHLYEGWGKRDEASGWKRELLPSREHGLDTNNK